MVRVYYVGLACAVALSFVIGLSIPAHAQSPTPTPVYGGYGWPTVLDPAYSYRCVESVCCTDTKCSMAGPVSCTAIPSAEDSSGNQSYVHTSDWMTTTTTVLAGYRSCTQSVQYFPPKSWLRASASCYIYSLGCASGDCSSARMVGLAAPNPGNGMDVPITLDGFRQFYSNQWYTGTVSNGSTWFTATASSPGSQYVSPWGGAIGASAQLTTALAGVVAGGRVRCTVSWNRSTPTPTPTATGLPATATATPIPATATATPIPATATATRLPGSFSIGSVQTGTLSEDGEGRVVMDSVSSAAMEILEDGTHRTSIVILPGLAWFLGLVALISVPLLIKWFWSWVTG